MLTPSFELSQSDTFLTVVIKTPFAKAADTEIFIEEDEFRFYSKPYFLRLSLPGRIVEDGREKADYNVNDGTFTIKVPKETPGEHFEGLDMITKLLTPKGKKSAAQPLIEVIGETDTQESPDLEEEELEYDWHIDQHEFVESDVSLSAPKYGFASTKSGLVHRLQDEVREIIDLPDPDHTNIADRQVLRKEVEDSKFDPEYYLADLYDDDNIQEVIKFKAFWEGKDTHQVTFTEEEKDQMKNLPKKEYLIEDSVLTSVYLGLVDILFAYAYNHRMTDGENNVESDWTICKLSSTLSWFEVFYSITDVAVSCVRRGLCYPLYRNLNLTNKVLKDTVQIISQGKLTILKCLLETRQILLQQYPRYILNDLYITDYCVWIQAASDKRLKSLAENLGKVVMKKEDVGFGLDKLEETANSEDCEIEHLTERFSNVEVDSRPNKESCVDSDDETESECTDSDESDTSDDTDTSDESLDSDDENKSLDKSRNENKTDQVNESTKDKDTNEQHTTPQIIEL